MIYMILSKTKLCIFHNVRDIVISITSHDKISYHYLQGAIRHEDINVGTHGDIGIPEHLM